MEMIETLEDVAADLIVETLQGNDTTNHRWYDLKYRRKLAERVSVVEYLTINNILTNTLNGIRTDHSEVVAY